MQGTIPGVPLVLTGRSDLLGWGITSSYLDDQDIFIEEVDPDDPTRYRTPNGWASFRTRDSIIGVKDSAAETLKLRWTENGPVLAPDQYDLGTVTPAGHVAALSWTALSPDDTTLSAGIRLMNANSVAEAMTASEGFIAPSQNITVVDRTQIAMKVIGAIPNRNERQQGQGRLPSYGYIATNRWDGVQPADANPLFEEPVGDILGNTGERVIKGEAAHVGTCLERSRLDHVAPNTRAVDVTEDAFNEQRVDVGEFREQRPQLILRQTGTEGAAKLPLICWPIGGAAPACLRVPLPR